LGLNYKVVDVSFNEQSLKINLDYQSLAWYFILQIFVLQFNV